MYKCEVEVQPPNAFYICILCLRLHYVHLASDLTVHSLMPGGTHSLDLRSVCTYGLFGTSLRHNMSHAVRMH